MYGTLYLIYRLTDAAWVDVWLPSLMYSLTCRDQRFLVSIKQCSMLGLVPGRCYPRISTQCAVYALSPTQRFPGIFKGGGWGEGGAGLEHARAMNILEDWGREKVCARFAVSLPMILRVPCYRSLSLSNPQRLLRRSEQPMHNTKNAPVISD